MSFEKTAAEMRQEIADLEEQWEEAVAERELDPLEARVMLLEAQVAYLIHLFAGEYGQQEAGTSPLEWTRGQNTIFSLLDSRQQSLIYALDLLEGEVDDHDEQMAEWEQM